jgi:DNA-binding PadR family transcriptional regulator
MTTSKVGTDLVRDAHGRVVQGALNPNGRPKKGFTLTDIAKQILEENMPDGMSRKEKLMRKVATLADEGNETMIKLMWNYVDGMPTQRQEITGKDGEPLEVNTKLTPDQKKRVRDTISEVIRESNERG